METVACISCLQVQTLALCALVRHLLIPFHNLPDGPRQECTYHPVDASELNIRHLDQLQAQGLPAKSKGLLSTQGSFRQSPIEMQR